MILALFGIADRSLNLPGGGLHLQDDKGIWRDGLRNECIRKKGLVSARGNSDLVSAFAVDPYRGKAGGPLHGFETAEVDAEAAQRLVRGLTVGLAPTQPMKPTRAPSRAAAIAWFARLPPTACVNVGVSTVSPTTGKCGRRNVKSTLIDPETMIIGELVSGAAWSGIRSHPIHLSKIDWSERQWTETCCGHYKKGKLLDLHVGTIKR
jgi:hypothetical protein